VGYPIPIFENPSQKVAGNFYVGLLIFFLYFFFSLFFILIFLSIFFIERKRKTASDLL